MFNRYGFGIKSEGRVPSTKLNVTYFGNSFTTGKNVKWDEAIEGSTIDFIIEGYIAEFQESIKSVYRFKVIDKGYEDGKLKLTLENDKFGTIVVKDVKNMLRRNKDKKLTNKAFIHLLIDNYLKERSKTKPLEDKCNKVESERNQAVEAFRDKNKQFKEQKQEYNLMKVNFENQIAELQEQLGDGSFTKEQIDSGSNEVADQLTEQWELINNMPQEMRHELIKQIAVMSFNNGLKK